MPEFRKLSQEEVEKREREEGFDSRPVEVQVSEALARGKQRLQTLEEEVMQLIQENYDRR